MLEIKNFYSGYQDLEVLKGINLKLPTGKVSVLMGPNGAGKSTLIKSVFNLVKAISGTIMFEGLNTTNLPAHQLIKLGISYLPQGKINFAELNVTDNLLLGGYHIKDEKFVKEQLETVYTKFPVLKSIEKQFAFSLSGGQQQMLAMGRALISRPKLLLLDEPSLGLAPKVVEEVFEIVKKINQEFGTTILVVEHNIKSILKIADYGFVMAEGRILAQDTCVNLKKSEIMKKVFIGKLE